MSPERGKRVRRRSFRRAAATSRAARPMRSLQSSAMGPRAGAGWPSNESAAATPGAARDTTPYLEDLKPSERQQEFDPRRGAERVCPARLDVGGEQIFPGGQPAEHARWRTASSSRCRSRSRSRRPYQLQGSCNSISAALASSPRVADPDALASGSINLKGAQIDDLLLVNQKQTIAKNSPPVRLLSPLGAPGAYIAQFGWTAEGGPGAGPRHDVDRGQPELDARSSR